MIINQPPKVIIDYIQPVDLKPDLLLTLTGTGYDSNNDTLSYAWKQSPNNPVATIIRNPDNAITAVTDFVKAGDYIFELTVSDYEYRVSESITITINLATVTISYAEFELKNPRDLDFAIKSINLSPVVADEWAKYVSFTIEETDINTGNSTSNFDYTATTVSIPASFERRDYAELYLQIMEQTLITQTFYFNNEEVGKNRFKLFFNFHGTDGYSFTGISTNTYLQEVKHGSVPPGQFFTYSDNTFQGLNGHIFFPPIVLTIDELP